MPIYTGNYLLPEDLKNYRARISFPYVKQVLVSERQALSTARCFFIHPVHANFLQPFGPTIMYKDCTEFEWMCDETACD